jgi:hypothetical protein
MDSQQAGEQGESGEAKVEQLSRSKRRKLVKQAKLVARLEQDAKSSGAVLLQLRDGSPEGGVQNPGRSDGPGPLVRLGALKIILLWMITRSLSGVTGTQIITLRVSKSHKLWSLRWGMARTPMWRCTAHT